MAIYDVPGYLNIEFEDDTNIMVQRIVSQSTYIVRLDTYSTIEQYLKQNFGPKSRSALNRYRRRLETCFNIRYSCYFGDIERSYFDRLIRSLRELMSRRFQKKGERNYELQHLDEIANDVYPLILRKKACLFVIYDGKNPISIRINMMKDSFAYYLLSAYDPDFDTFRLGKIDMVVNLEWLFEHNYQIYDLLKGYAYIKEQWADETHEVCLYLTSEKHTVFDSIPFFFQSIFFKSFYSGIALAKRLKMHVLLKWFKTTFYPYKSIRKKVKSYKLTLLDKVPSIDPKNCLQVKDISNSDFLKLPIYNLAYKHQLKTEKIQVFHNKKDEKKYYAKLGNSYYELSFT